MLYFILFKGRKLTTLGVQNQNEIAKVDVTAYDQNTRETVNLTNVIHNGHSTTVDVILAKHLDRDLVRKHLSFCTFCNASSSHKML